MAEGGHQGDLNGEAEIVAFAKGKTLNGAVIEDQKKSNAKNTGRHCEGYRPLTVPVFYGYSDGLGLRCSFRLAICLLSAKFSSFPFHR